MTITLVLDVPGLTTPADAQAFVKDLAEQIVELPVNADSSIKSITSSYYPKREKGRA